MLKDIPVSEILTVVVVNPLSHTVNEQNFEVSMQRNGKSKINIVN